MPEGLTRVLTRIHDIEALLGEPAASNEEFGAELARSLSPSNHGATPARPAVPSEGIDPAAHAGLPGAPDALAPLIQTAAEQTGVPEALISAVTAAESGYRPDAVSPTGAIGLMQLMPGTARALGIEDPFDPGQNLLGGARYLQEQLGRFGSIEKALAAYNAGPGAVEKYGGIPPFAETRHYVQHVLERLRHLTSRRE